jgi:hypothetical protein
VEKKKRERRTAWGGMAQVVEHLLGTEQTKTKQKNRKTKQDQTLR